MTLLKPGRAVAALTLFGLAPVLGACAEPFVYQNADTAAPTVYGRATVDVTPPVQTPVVVAAASQPTGSDDVQQSKAVIQEVAVPAAQPPQQNLGTAAADGERCQPLDLTLSFKSGGTIAGRATGPGGHWYASGEFYENGNALVQLWQPTYWADGPDNARGAKPFTVWRGSVIDGELRLFEQPPSCGRSLIAPAPDVNSVYITKVVQ